jgi:hypothetical protein
LESIDGIDALLLKHVVGEKSAVGSSGCLVCGNYAS